MKECKLSNHVLPVLGTGTLQESRRSLLGVWCFIVILHLVAIGCLLKEGWSPQRKGSAARTVVPVLLLSDEGAPKKADSPAEPRSPEDRYPRSPRPQEEKRMKDSGVPSPEWRFEAGDEPADIAGSGHTRNLDLDGAKRRAIDEVRKELAAKDSSGLIPRKSESQRFEERLQSALRPDCGDGESDKKRVLQGLLALPRVAKDTLTDTGCRWR